MDNYDNYFSLGIAKDEAFCNRVKEREHLQYNIAHSTHTLLISPRRYGKTSLALKIADELALPFINMDFTLATDKNNVQNIINTSIGILISNFAPAHKKAFALALKFFAKMRPQLVLDYNMGMHIELHPDFSSAQIAINELLLNADKMAIAAKKRAIILMDEFQQLATLENATTIEAAIRNAAQSMQNISIIFSGSNRHLLQLMFDDSSRPLYHLCDKISLDRISEIDYRLHLQKAAEKRWHRQLSNELIEKILSISERHPYYLNVICSRLWRKNSIFNIDNVEKIWQDYLAEEENRIGFDISKLSNHQKKFLLLLSTNDYKQPTSKEVVNNLNISVGSAAKSFATLLQNDYIYKDSETGVYKILDPLIATYLRKCIQ